jgi:hypothetical protein
MWLVRLMHACSSKQHGATQAQRGAQVSDLQSMT